MPVLMKVLHVDVGSKRISFLRGFAKLFGLEFWLLELDVDVYKTVKRVHEFELRRHFGDLCKLHDTIIE